MAHSNPTALRRAVSNIYLLWVILAVPAVWLVFSAVVLRARLPYLEWTGVLSCWLLIAALAVTPLQLVFGALPWLRQRRRYLGVASFGYASLHLAVWLSNARPGAFLHSFVRPEVLPGWIAIAMMLPLALTSSNLAVRRLGPAWKSLQRWVYPMAILTLLHWLMTNKDWTMIIVYTGPLILLMIWRVWRRQRRAGG